MSLATDSLSSRILASFQAAGIYNARIVDETSHPEAFGNAFCLVEVNGLAVQFIRDRGQIFIDILKSSTDRAIDFRIAEIAKNFNRHETHHNSWFTDSSLNLGIELIAKNIEQIKALLRSKNFEK